MGNFGTGFDAQVGIATEATYGTYVAPTSFLEVEDAAVDPVVKSIDYFPIVRGLVLRSGYHREKVVGGTGTSKIAVMSKGSLLHFKHALGSLVSAQVGATAEYKHTATPDLTNGKRGLFASMQVGMPQTDATVQPFTGLGGKVTAWQLDLSKQDWLKFAATWDFKTVVTSEALAAASYPTGPAPFSALDLTLTVNGVAIATLDSLSIKGDNPMKTDREDLAANKNEPLANGEWKFTGTFQGSEFDSMTAFNHWLAGDEVANVVGTLTGATIPTTANPYKVVITIPLIRYTGDAPKLNGTDVVQQNQPFQALYDGTNAPITIEIHSDETSA